MKRPALIALAVQAVVLFALPGVIQLVGRADVHFILTILVLMILQPLCCLGTGIFAGLNIKSRWWLVLTGAALALCADLIFYALDIGFLLYVGRNFLAGVIGLAAAALIKHLSQRYR